MSEDKPLKYIGVNDIQLANALVENGYKLHSAVPRSDRDGNQWITYIMSLSDPSKYDDIDRFKKIPIESEEQTIPEGWRVIHHTSKELIIVKDK